jgi:hypothetical protein
MESALSTMSTKRALLNSSASLRNVQLAQGSPGEGLSALKPYDVGPNFTRTQFSTVPGRRTQTDDQHECRAQRDEGSCVC